MYKLKPKYFDTFTLRLLFMMVLHFLNSTKQKGQFFLKQFYATENSKFNSRHETNMVYLLLKFTPSRLMHCFKYRMVVYKCTATLNKIILVKYLLKFCEKSTPLMVLEICKIDLD